MIQAQGGAEQGPLAERLATPLVAPQSRGQREATMTLKDQARAVRENAHVPYSRFKVGAAIRAGSGAVHLGCNVENVAYPEGTCAEAGAISAMVAAGDTEIVEVYVVADSPVPVTPCGGCRQKIAEFAGPDVVVTMANLEGAETRMTVRQLLPGAFDAGQMERA
jgi:cytidine deaminase